MKQRFYLLRVLVLNLMIFFFVSCSDTSEDFNRNPSQIHYSKHASCRMSCRHIDESEVKELVEDGKINYTKSDLNEDACHKRYALEGYSRDNQNLRIIVAECNNELTVITVIDLGKEWPCECE
jgi:hypothetical protein